MAGLDRVAQLDMLVYPVGVATAVPQALNDPAPFKVSQYLQNRALRDANGDREIANACRRVTSERDEDMGVIS